MSIRAEDIEAKNINDNKTGPAPVEFRVNLNLLYHPGNDRDVLRMFSNIAAVAGARKVLRVDVSGLADAWDLVSVHPYTARGQIQNFRDNFKTLVGHANNAQHGVEVAIMVDKPEGDLYGLYASPKEIMFESICFGAAVAFAARPERWDGQYSIGIYDPRRNIAWPEDEKRTLIEVVEYKLPMGVRYPIKLNTDICVYGAGNNGHASRKKSGSNLVSFIK